MFNIGKLASGLLDSIDSAAQNTATDGEVKMTATEIRSLNRRNRGADGSDPRGASSPAPAVSASASSNSLSSVRSSSTFPVDSTTRGAVRPEGAGAGLSSATSSASLTGSVSESVDGADADEDAATAAPASAARTAYATPPAQAESSKATNRAGSGSSSGGAVDCHAIEVLNQECLELENENSALKEEIRDVWANYKALQDRTSASEGELQALKLEHAALLGEKENSPEEAKIKALTHRLEDGRAREAKLESEVRRLNDLNGQLQEQVTEHYSVVSTLKNQEDERVLSLTQEHMRILKAAQSHAMELENRCAALSNTNADLYRENQKLGDRLSKQTVDATIHADYTALESKHALLESKHAALDTQHAQSAERLRLAEERLTAAEAQCQQFSREKNETLYAHGVKVKELEQALAKAVRAGTEGGGGHGGEPHASTAMVNELQLQCSTLSQQIMKKQGVILELQAEKSTLKSRLNDYLKRIQDLEAEAAASTDLEYSNSQPAYGSRGGSQPYQRAYSVNSKTQNTITNQLILLNILPKSAAVHGPGGSTTNLQWVLYALEGFDHYCYMLLRAVATSPLLRCVFMVYILALHFWSFVVIVYHATVLDMDVVGGDALNATIGTPDTVTANARRFAKVASSAYKNSVGPDGPGAVVG